MKIFTRVIDANGEAYDSEFSGEDGSIGIFFIPEDWREITRLVHEADGEVERISVGFDRPAAQQSDADREEWNERFQGWYAKQLNAMPHYIPFITEEK